jgi:competence protein ComFC
MFHKILNYIYPKKCMFCGEIIEAHLQIESCSHCFRMIDFYEGDFPKRELTPSRFCDGVFCVAQYEGALRQAIIKYKFFDKEAYFRGFARLLFEKIQAYHKETPFDVCLAVPLHKKRLKERGYNQAELISQEVSRLLNIREVSYALSKTMHTTKQSLTKKDERKKNIKDAFQVVAHEEISLKKILLIDDILTTGSTVEGISKILKEAGAKEVFAGVIAVAGQT